MVNKTWTKQINQTISEMEQLHVVKQMTNSVRKTLIKETNLSEHWKRNRVIFYYTYQIPPKSQRNQQSEIDWTEIKLTPN